MIPPIIEINNLYFSFTSARPLFINLNLTIAKGSSLCVVGHERAGKTTLFRLIKGLISPSAGAVTFRPEARTSFLNVGYLGGDPNDSFVGVTVEEEIVFGPENLGLAVKEIRARLNQALELTGLKGYEQRLVHTLSGGEQQKLALAAALVMDLHVLILDDALSMMDPPSRNRHWAWINKLKRELNLTVLFTTNRLDELRSADRALFLDANVHDFVFDGDPEQFISSDLCDEWIEFENGLERIQRYWESLNGNQAFQGLPLFFKPSRLSGILKLVKD